MSVDTDPIPSPASAWDAWARRLGALAVAVVAAYASYQHQRGFALDGGADPATARLWPLSVDGLLVLSTAGLLRTSATRRARHTLRIAFAVGIVVSLAANIASAPAMTWAPILVAGWPPVALLLAVELLGHHRDHALAGERNNDSVREQPRDVSPVSHNSGAGDVGPLRTHCRRRTARTDRS